jgi:hypothetical protein
MQQSTTPQTTMPAMPAVPAIPGIRIVLSLQTPLFHPTLHRYRRKGQPPVPLSMPGLGNETQRVQPYLSVAWHVESVWCGMP